MYHQRRSLSSAGPPTLVNFMRIVYNETTNRKGEKAPESRPAQAARANGMIIAAILLPVLAGAVLPLMKCENMRQRGIYVEAAAVATSVLAVLAALRGGDALSVELLPGLPLALRSDSLSSVFALLVAGLWPLASLYAFAYMEREEWPDRFFAWYLVSDGVTLCVAFSANLLTLYLSYECLTLSTLPLVNHKDDGPSRRAGMKYAAWTIGGAALGFVAMAVALSCGGASSFARGGILTGNPEILRWVYLLAFLGFGVKAAVAPFSAWLPAASVAPTPVTALLHAVAVVNAGAFAVMRVTFDVFGTAVLYGTFAQTAALAIACFTILLGAVMAVRERHLKRRLAWSTVSNLSYMLMGVALMTEAGLEGALTHMVFHGLMKITLFFGAGAILTQTGKEYIQDIRGFGKIMPWTCGTFALAAVALTGIPPLCGFVSKWRLLTAAVNTGLPMGTVATVTLIAAAVLTAVYALSPVISMYFRPLNPENRELSGKRLDPDARMLIPMAAIAAMTVVAGLWQ